MEINSPKGFYLHKPEVWFDNLLSQMQQVTKPDYLDSMFFHINSEIYMEIYNDVDIYASYTKIWLIFETRFGLNHQQIKDLIKGVVEEHTNLKGLTPFYFSYTPLKRWQNIQI